VVAAFAAEMTLFKRPVREAALRLGLGEPSIRVLAVTAWIGVGMQACYPLITTVTGARFALPSNAVPMLLGIFVMNGIAEEMMMRGYLFRHLRGLYGFGRALAWVMVIHAAAHIPILYEAGPLVGGTAVVTALAIGVPMAYLFERGRNTIWGPALLHFFANTIIVVAPPSGMTQPGMQMGAALWLVVVIIVPYLGLGIWWVVVRRMAPARG
jgi:membrane protease YdiL (CAAX protease family)